MTTLLVIVSIWLVIGAIAVTIFSLAVKRENNRFKVAKDEVAKQGPPHPDGHNPWQFYDPDN